MSPSGGSSTSEFHSKAISVINSLKPVSRETVYRLQSGSAKDFIAIMLIKELSKHVRKSCSDILMFTVFVVNTAKLVTHQANIIKTHTNLKVAEYPKELDREFEVRSSGK
ncbi:putative endoribonuclease Dicer-like [Apostichopus japonicus]|uniref:Putative endoribonuclease Dicer-like n=1 Tax=Stichopus japonicus TaxID=307972 RepID=A0A2G8L570_STIJA|nr:putative endoribonuclease Dicer-like [Apostichopus japonicus]